jgi:uncharacterized protein YbaP (TraB family)
MKKQSLLWSIEHPNLAYTSYVFGTMHVQDLRAFEHFELAKIALESCDAFATEFRLDEADPVKAAAHFALDDGVMLTDVLTRKQFEKADKFLSKRFNLSLNNFLFQKPLVVTNFLSSSILQQEMQQSLDETLFTHAKSIDKILLGLETFEQQLLILDNISLKSQSKQLMSMVKNFKPHRKAIDKLTAHYIKGNILQLYKSSKKGMGKLRKPMLYDRNKIMIDRIDEIVQEQSLFAGIGAAHLAGSKGVLRGLKQKGYKVKPCF